MHSSNNFYIFQILWTAKEDSGVYYTGSFQTYMTFVFRNENNNIRTSLKHSNGLLSNERAWYVLFNNTNNLFSNAYFSFFSSISGST